MDATATPTVLVIMLCLSCQLGGAEKRYARAFEMLVAQSGSAHNLLINREMLKLLHSADILTRHDAYLIVLDPPSTRWHWLARRRYLAHLADTCWLMWQCWFVIRRLHPQIVHPLLTGVYLCLPARLLLGRVRWVLSAYSYNFESVRERHVLGIAVGATMKRFMMRRSARIDALTHAIRTDLVARGIDPQKVLVAPGSFTDLTRCNPAPIKERAIVFAGRFIDIKMPLLLAYAIPAVIRRHPDVSVWFLGTGPLEAQIRQVTHELHVAEHVTIRFEPEPMRILNGSSIFVSLQRDENYPSQSLLEAMACANAIVATDVGESWRLVDETNGLRVPPKAEAVAAALITLLDDPMLPQRQQAARQRVLEQHTAESFYRYMIHLYQEAAVGEVV